MSKFFRSSWVTPLTGLAFAFVAFTGVLMLFHMGSGPMREIHEWGGILLVALGLVHAIIHWKSFVTYLGRRGTVVSLIVIILACVALAMGGGRHEGGPEGGRGMHGYHGGRLAD